MTEDGKRRIPDGKRRTRAQVLAIWSFGVVHAAIGLALAIGGAVLLLQGGELFYLAAGGTELVIAFMCFKRWGWNFVLYGFLLVGTLLWALWQVRLNGAALASLLLAPTVLGLAMLPLPTHRICGPPSRWWIGGPALAILATVVLAGGLDLIGGHGAPAPSAFAATSGPPSRVATVQYDWVKVVDALGLEPRTR